MKGGSYGRRDGSKGYHGWTAPLPDFHFVLFDRTDPVQNTQRFYLVAWLPTLFEEGAVVRIFGRKGVSQRLYSTPFPSLAEA